MMAHLLLPEKAHFREIDPKAEPTRFYYWPVVGWFYRRRLEMILHVIGDGPYPNILEVAYGSGVFLPSLARLTDDLHGIDLHQMQDTVYENLSRSGTKAELIQGDALAMPYEDGRFACVVNISMLEHLTDPGAAISEMLRVLSPGGILVLGFPSRNPWMDATFRALGYNPRAIHPSSHREILNALKIHRKPDVVNTLPGFVPLDATLYVVTVARK